AALRDNNVPDLTIHRVQVEGLSVSSSKFIHGFPASVIGVVVVDDHKSAADNLVEQILQTDFRGGIPVRVDSQESDSVDLLVFSRQDLLKPTRVPVEIVCIVSDLVLQ